MIGKAKSCVGGFSIFNYVMDEEKGYELFRNNLSGETPLEIMQEMKIIQSLNQRATNKLFSFALSPHISEGSKLSKEELTEMTKDFLAELKMNWEDEQFLAFVHTEKEHHHIHILMNRVDEQGKLKKDHHIGKKAQWAAHRVAKKHGLISAKQIRIDKIKALEQDKQELKATRKEIYDKHKFVMENFRPTTLQKYRENMKRFKVEFIPTINKQGELQGFRIKDLKTDTEFKASDIHRKMGLKSLLESGLKVDPSEFRLSPTLQAFYVETQSHKQEVKTTAAPEKKTEISIAKMMDEALTPIYVPEQESMNDKLFKNRKRRKSRR